MKAKVSRAPWGGPLADLPVGKGCSFYISTALAVASETHHVIFGPSVLTPRL